MYLYLFNFYAVHRATLVDDKHHIFRDAGEIRWGKVMHKISIEHLR